MYTAKTSLSKPSTVILSLTLFPSFQLHMHQCAHVYQWNSDGSGSFYCVIWCCNVGSLSRPIYCSFVISEANNFLPIPHIWFLVRLLLWLFWWSLIFWEFQLKCRFFPADIFDIFSCLYDVELSLKCLGKTVWTTVPPQLNTETETLNFPVGKINQL